MSLTIVTGPANSAKAAVVLERYRALLARAPILVVPRAADATQFRRELALDGLVLGTRVESFRGLSSEIARRAGIGGPPLAGPAIEELIARAVEDVGPAALAGAAASPRFASEFARFAAELELRRVSPARLGAALRAWSTADAARAPAARELAAIYGAHRARIERIGRHDEAAHALAALDALALAPARWGATPVLCYGFDDLDLIQLATLETLAHAAHAPVVLSLPGEPGRVALEGRAATFETLRPRAREVIELAARSDYYEPDARELLSHLERHLFEPTPPRRAPGPALALLEALDERDEVELIASEIEALLEEGFAPGELAVLARDPESIGPALAERLEAHAIPATLAGRVSFGASPIGRGVLGLLRAAMAGGEASDLLAWLRTPGCHEQASVDRFEARLRRRGVRSAREALVLWAREHAPIASIEALRGGGEAMLAALELLLDEALAAPAPRLASALDELDAAAWSAARRAVGALRELAGADRGLRATPRSLLRALERLEVEREGSVAGDAVTICDALSLRARRVRVLFICALAEGSFPAGEREEPFLSANERHELAHAGGLALSVDADAEAAERYLFYALCSRPTAGLRLSWHTTSEDGAPLARSPFIDDVLELLEPGALRERRPTLALAPPGGFGGGAEAPIGPLAEPALLATLRGHRAHSPSALEAWTRCPVAWFLERALRAEPLEPDPPALARGGLAHDVLAALFVALEERTGSSRVHPGNLALAQSLLEELLAARARAIAVEAGAERAERRRLRADLGRYLERAAALESTHSPAAFELAFGLENDPHAAVVLADGALELCGRVDRVDIDSSRGTAIVYDYKGADAPGAEAWSARGRVQPALYMLATEQLLGVEALGGLYQPLRGGDLRARGVLREDADPALPMVRGDRRSAAELDALLAERLAAAVASARELEHGRLEPRPQSCGSDGRCRFPTLCRCVSR